jgi:hypothetical protein
VQVISMMSQRIVLAIRLRSSRFMGSGFNFPCLLYLRRK